MKLQLHALAIDQAAKDPRVELSALLTFFILLGSKASWGEELYN